MTKKLLHKTLQAYLIYSAVILIIIAPLFYFITQKLNIEEADEGLILRKDEFILKFNHQLTKNEIANWNKFNRDIKILADKKLLKDTLFDNFYLDSLSNEVEHYRELNSPIIIENKPYTLSAKVNLVETEDLVMNIAILFLILITLLLIGLFVITKKLSKSIWEPFYSLLHQIELFEIDKQKPLPFRNSNIEEFNRLNQSVEKLIEKNLIIYENQREFIENAAHELQTPLAVFQSKIDNLLQDPNITKKQTELLDSLNTNVLRLSRLNKNLLLLSKIDSSQYSDVVNFSLNQLIEKNIDFFKEQAQSKNIEITTVLKESISLKANQGLSEILINNLLLNAIKHNVINGKITIEIINNKLIISNTGISSPLNQDKLFTRFSKINSSEHGNGLGLAIVKKIITLNKWTITYHFNDNLHHFSVEFT